MSEPNIAAFLLTLPDVTALINDRAHLLVVPQQHRGSGDAYPCVVIQTPGDTPNYVLCGDDGVPLATPQIDCYARDADQARALGRAIRRGMRNYSGPMGSVTVQRVQLTADFDNGPEPETGLYRRTLLFNLWYVET